MITTRFGTQVQLIAPVDWNTGWASVVMQYSTVDSSASDVTRDVHVSELKADGGLNEIQAASDALEQHLCKDCEQAMEAVQQEMVNAPAVTLVTCRNRSCSLWSVTLTTKQYATLTDEQWSAYRQSVVNLKETLKLWSEKK